MLLKSKFISCAPDHVRLVGMIVQRLNSGQTHLILLANTQSETQASSINIFPLRMLEIFAIDRRVIYTYVEDSKINAYV